MRYVVLVAYRPGEWEDASEQVRREYFDAHHAFERFVDERGRRVSSAALCDVDLATILPTVLRARPLEEKIAVSRRFAGEVLPLFDTGRLRPVIDSRFPLADIAAAHDRMESNANVGKILIDVQP